MPATPPTILFTVGALCYRYVCLLLQVAIPLSAKIKLVFGRFSRALRVLQLERCVVRAPRAAGVLSAAGKARNAPAVDEQARRMPLQLPVADPARPRAHLSRPRERSGPRLCLRRALRLRMAHRSGLLLPSIRMPLQLPVAHPYRPRQRPGPRPHNHVLI